MFIFDCDSHILKPNNDRNSAQLTFSNKRLSDKLVTDEENLDEKQISSFDKVEVKNEQQIEINIKPVEEQDEIFDQDGYNFFADFIKNNQNHPIREKMEKILDIFSKGSINNIPLTNKLKNEILRNLKTQYLQELEELNSKFNYFNCFLI